VIKYKFGVYCEINEPILELLMGDMDI